MVYLIVVLMLISLIMTLNMITSVSGLSYVFDQVSTSFNPFLKNGLSFFCISSLYITGKSPFSNTYFVN